MTAWVSGSTEVAALLPEVLGSKEANTLESPDAPLGCDDIAPSQRHGSALCRAIPERGHARRRHIAAVLIGVLGEIRPILPLSLARAFGSNECDPVP